MKPQIFERFEWREAMECLEWYLEMCRDAREGFGQFQENLSEMFKAGSRADSGHHLSGQDEHNAWGTAVQDSTSQNLEVSEEKWFPQLVFRLWHYSFFQA